MATTFTIKRGDTAPAFRAQLLNGTTPVDLTTAIQVRLILKRGDTTLIAGPMVVEAEAGWVRRAWQTSDTTTAATYRAEIEVTWNDTTIQTFPATGYATIQVTPDL